METSTLHFTYTQPITQPFVVAGSLFAFDKEYREIHTLLPWILDSCHSLSVALTSAAIYLRLARGYGREVFLLPHLVILM